MKFKPVCLLIVLLILSSCKSSNKKLVPVIGFLDYVQDETLEQAKKGFFVALKDSGFDPMMKTLEVVYRNAQSDQPTLLQACDYLISQKSISSRQTLHCQPLLLYRKHKKFRYS